MKTKIIQEAGIEAALLGLGLSHGVTKGMSWYDIMFGEDDELCNRLFSIAKKLAHKQGGHNKFLESIQVWIDINAPRFWWSEFDTYRVGMSKQSESTMHTLKKSELTQANFEYLISINYLDTLNQMIANNASIFKLKNALPDGFLQRRIVSTNYKVLQNIIAQRKNHKLPQWRSFCDDIIDQVVFRSFLEKE